MDDVTSIFALYDLRTTRIFATYADHTSDIDRRLSELKGSGNPTDYQISENMKEISTHAYFCLYYFQLEWFVKSALKVICNRRQKEASSVDKLAWHWMSNRVSNLDILDAVRFMLPERRDIHQEIEEYKKKYRNRIVHQGDLETRIDNNSAFSILNDLAMKIYMEISLNLDIPNPWPPRPTPEAAP